MPDEAKNKACALKGEFVCPECGEYAIEGGEEATVWKEVDIRVRFTMPEDGNLSTVKSKKITIVSKEGHELANLSDVSGHALVNGEIFCENCEKDVGPPEEWGIEIEE